MEETLTFQIVKLYQQFVSYSKTQLQRVDLSFGLLQFVVFIGKQPGASQSQMAAFLGTDAAYTTRAVEKLMESGHVRREKSAQDKRVWVLYLTPKGEEAFLLAHEVFDQWDGRFMAGMSPKQRADCVLQLRQLRKAGKEDV